jgi:hypothetical protein
MATEWLRIMLDEIARKEQEAREAREEEARRQADSSGEPPQQPGSDERPCARR